MSTRNPIRRSTRLGAALGGSTLVIGVLAAACTSTGPSSSSTASATCPVTGVANESLPSVVTIQAGSGSSAGTGSGTIIRSDGYILTNDHVVAPAAGGGSLSVVFDNGNSANATITGRDPLTDLAVIRVSGESGLRTISFGNSSSVRIGQQVIALGAPLGLSSTVTSGIASALDRIVAVPSESVQSALLIDAIQTDAAINPGNSGGALVDCAGRLIGVPTAGATVSGESAAGSIGLGFAIPVDHAKTVSDEIISTGRVTYSYLGLQARPLSANPGATNGGASGVQVTAVVPGGPVDAAGLRAGDVITSIDGRPARKTDQLVAITLGRRPGDRVEIGYERQGHQATTTIVVGAQP
jgi:putative serine protease PepD